MRFENGAYDWDNFGAPRVWPGAGCMFVRKAFLIGGDEEDDVKQDMCFKYLHTINYQLFGELCTALWSVVYLLMHP